MSERILIVEDESELCLTLADRLRSNGYVIETASDGEIGLKKSIESKFDLIILDIFLPKYSGFEICAMVRRAGIMTPILMISALGHSANKVAGLNLGADDYVTKPFDAQEFVARVKALLRRNGTPAESKFYRFAAIEVDIRKAKVYSNGEEVSLTSTEFQLLLYFLDHAGDVITRQELLRQVWSHRGDTLTRTVDMHVANLRQKLQSSPKDPAMILTVHGVGYKFELRPPFTSELQGPVDALPIR